MTTSSPERRGLPSPLEVAIPSECKGWEELYPYHAVFSEDRRAFDESRLWFQDSLHGPEPVHPFDFVWWDYGVAAMNQANTRLFVVPPSLGAEYRVLNGYVYFSANSVTDEETLARRAELFARAEATTTAHWDEIYGGGWRRSRRPPASSSCSRCPRFPSSRTRPSSRRAAASARATRFSPRTTASSEGSTASCNTTSSS